MTDSAESSDISPLNSPKGETSSPKDDIPLELQEIISDILPSTDPIDSPSFDPAEYINNLFPTEQSLSTLDSAITKMKSKIAATDQQILKSVRAQVSAGSKGKRDLEEAKRAIGELFSKINDIKDKAERSETMVTEICRDIKTLDYAKKNLTSTIATLQNLFMLITGVEKLKIFSENHQYKQAGDLLGALNQLSNQFGDYKHIPKLQETNEQLSSIRQTLHSEVRKDFKNFLESNVSGIGPSASVVRDACVVIDALGKEEKREFMAWFCERELSDYNRYFDPTAEASKLENTERRFALLKRQLNNYDQKYSSIFPKEWRMDELICEEFCFTTRQDLADTLEKNKHTLDVDVLVSTIKKTIAFEKELCDRFGAVQVWDAVEEEDEEDDEDDEKLSPEEIANPQSAAAIRARWRRYQKQKLNKEKKKQQPREIQKFRGIISSEFDLYMDLYIAKEETNMRAALNKMLSEETWIVDDDERNKVLMSSTDLIFYFKNSMKLCATLSKGQPLFDLHKLFKKTLSEYNAHLLQKIPGPDVKVGEKEEKMLCLIINTGEYCSQTTQGMTESMRKTINKGFAEKIDFTEQQSEFDGLIASSTKGLVNGLTAKMESALQQVTKLPLGTMEMGEEPSDYVNQITTYMKQTVPLSMEWLANPSHFRFFCDSLCASFIPLLVQYIYKCKRISIDGAKQLLLDFGTIKASLLELPNLGRQQPTPVPGRYTRYIHKEVGKAELLLKVLFTPEASLADTYKSLIPNHSEGDFQKIMDLKGVARSEQRVMLEQYSQTPASPGESATPMVGPQGSKFKSMLSGFSKDMSEALQKRGETSRRILGNITQKETTH